MSFTLPPLPYAPDALEPHIDKMTMEIHHGKHHNAYVTNLNKALESAPNLANKTVEELLANNCAIVPDNIKTAVRNNGGGHINHSMFWTIMGPKAGGQPGGKLADARLPTGAPPLPGPMICQNMLWFQCPPPLLRTAVRMFSGTIAQLLASSSSMLFDARAGADSRALLRFVT